MDMIDKDVLVQYIRDKTGFVSNRELYDHLSAQSFHVLAYELSRVMSKIGWCTARQRIDGNFVRGWKPVRQETAE